MRSLAVITILLILTGMFWQLTNSADLPFGQRVYSEADDYFLRYGQEETGANNIVTSVLFDYRGLDTLGEATVLYIAVLGVSLIFRRLIELDGGGGS